MLLFEYLRSDSTHYTYIPLNFVDCRQHSAEQYEVQTDSLQCFGDDSQLLWQRYRPKLHARGTSFMNRIQVCPDCMWEVYTTGRFMLLLLYIYVNRGSSGKLVYTWFFGEWCQCFYQLTDSILAGISFHLWYTGCRGPLPVFSRQYVEDSTTVRATEGTGEEMWSPMEAVSRSRLEFRQRNGLGGDKDYDAECDLWHRKVPELCHRKSSSACALHFWKGLWTRLNCNGLRMLQVEGKQFRQWVWSDDNFTFNMNQASIIQIFKKIKLGYVSWIYELG